MLVAPVAQPARSKRFGHCSQAVARVTATTPRPPVAVADGARVPVVGGSVTVPVLANDVAGAGPIVSVAIVTE